LDHNIQHREIENPEGLRLLVKELIGSGGFAKVYRAEILTPELAFGETKAALKVYDPEGDFTPERYNKSLARFRNEINMLTSMKKGDVEGLVHLPMPYGADFEDDEGHPYTAVALQHFDWSFEEWRRGRTFRDHAVMEREHLDKILDKIVQASRGVNTLHEYVGEDGRPILHRDIKPQNILVSRTGHTVLSDLGIARAPVELAVQSASLTRANQALGTPHYMPPEFFKLPGGAKKHACTQSDIYQMGGVLYFALTGYHPFEIKSLEDLHHDLNESNPHLEIEGTPPTSLSDARIALEQKRLRWKTGAVSNPEEDPLKVNRNQAYMIFENIRSGKLVPPREYNPEIPVRLEAICLKSMSLSPGDRQQDIDEFITEIENFVNNKRATKSRPRPQMPSADLVVLPDSYDVRGKGVESLLSGNIPREVGEQVSILNEVFNGVGVDLDLNETNYVRLGRKEYKVGEGGKPLFDVLAQMKDELRSLPDLTPTFDGYTLQHIVDITCSALGVRASYDDLPRDDEGVKATPRNIRHLLVDFRDELRQLRDYCVLEDVLQKEVTCIFQMLPSSRDPPKELASQLAQIGNYLQDHKRLVKEYALEIGCTKQEVARIRKLPVVRTAVGALDLLRDQHALSQDAAFKDALLHIYRRVHDVSDQAILEKALLNSGDFSNTYKGLVHSGIIPDSLNHGGLTDELNELSDSVTDTPILGSVSSAALPAEPEAPLPTLPLLPPPDPQDQKPEDTMTDTHEEEFDLTPDSGIDLEMEIRDVRSQLHTLAKKVNSGLDHNDQGPGEGLQQQIYGLSARQRSKKPWIVAGALAVGLVASTVYSASLHSKVSDQAAAIAQLKSDGAAHLSADALKPYSTSADIDKQRREMFGLSDTAAVNSTTIADSLSEHFHHAPVDLTDLTRRVKTVEDSLTSGGVTAAQVRNEIYGVLNPLIGRSGNAPVEPAAWQTYVRNQVRELGDSRYASNTDFNALRDEVNGFPDEIKSKEELDKYIRGFLTLQPIVPNGHRTRPQGPEIPADPFND
jgi:serine/threonine protein kinase